MKNQNLILYPGGAYGTFFEWVFNFLENPTIEMPFNSNGNSHKFSGNFLFPMPLIVNHINSGNSNKFSRTHPVLFEKVNHHEHCFENTYDKVLQEDIDFLKNHFNKILVVSFDRSSILWFEDNQLDKILLTDKIFDRIFGPYGYTRDFFKALITSDPIERIKHFIDLEIKSKLSPFKITNLQGWNKNNIYEFDIWDLRELLSFYWFTRIEGQLEGWQKLKLANNDLLHISITDLKEQFFETIIKSANYFGINVTAEQRIALETIHQHWLPLQTHINKDVICNTIVEKLRNNEYYDWKDIRLTIIDEAWIQKKLFDHGIGIKCDGLNIFPTNTNDFIPLLENIN